MDLITAILFILGFILLISGAELLVRGASRLAMAVGISPLVVGLTVVAYGTSSPELAVTIQSGYAGKADIAIGNVVGSNIANILLVLGLTASMAPLIVDQKLVRLEIPLMIGLSLLLFFFGLDGQIHWSEGAIFAMGAIIYTVFVIRQSRRETRAIKAQYDEEFDGQAAVIKSPFQLLIQIVFIVVGLGMLILGSRWLINGAVVLAQYFGVSELVVGLTIIAVGTSLPEIATSVVASRRNEQDIVVGNLIGSNIFNILFVLGFGSIVLTDGINVSVSALTFDIPVMIGVAIACLPIFFVNYHIARWEGILFLGYYVAYTVYLYLQATQNSVQEAFGSAIVFFVLPLTIITLTLIYVRAYRLSRSTNKSERVGNVPLHQGTPEGRGQ